MLRHSISTLVVMVLFACETSMAASITGVDLKFIGDSNPAKAEFSRDIESTSSVSARVTASLLSKPLQNNASVSSGWAIGAFASYAVNADISELGESRYGLNVSSFKENKRGIGAPFYRLSAGLSYLDAETEIRDSSIVNLSGSANFQPTGFLDTTVGVQLELRNASTEVFDTIKSTLFATVNFTPAPRMVLRTGLRYVIGDEVSSATPTVNIVNNATVIEPDAAFGGVGANRFAYQIDADSAIVEAGLGYEITNSVNGNILYRYVDTSADGDIGYDRSMVELTISIELN